MRRCSDTAVFDRVPSLARNNFHGGAKTSVEGSACAGHGRNFHRRPKEVGAFRGFSCRSQPTASASCVSGPYSRRYARVLSLWNWRQLAASDLCWFRQPLERRGSLEVLIMMWWVAASASIGFIVPRSLVAKGFIFMSGCTFPVTPLSPCVLQKNGFQRDFGHLLSCQFVGLKGLAVANYTIFTSNSTLWNQIGHSSNQALCLWNKSKHLRNQNEILPL